MHVLEPTAFDDAEGANLDLYEALAHEDPPTPPEVISAAALVCIAAELRWRRLFEAED